MTRAFRPTRLRSQRVKGGDLPLVNGLLAAGHDVYPAMLDSEDGTTAVLVREVGELADAPTDAEVFFAEDMLAKRVKADDSVWIYIIETG